jgi:branched-chain amino acid transport system ATP-binding protein
MKLTVRDLTAGYGSAMVIRDVSFEVESGASLAILGRNGMGKTTLVKAILGYLQHATGEVLLDDESTSKWPTYRIIQSGIAYGPQDAAIFPDRTVFENLQLGSLKVRDLRDRMDDVLADFPVLAQRLKQAAGTLSGGEQKMLILARALVSRPRLMILDEISEGLQPSVVTRAFNAIDRHRREQDMTLVLVEQSMDFAMSLADRVVLLQVGSVLFERARDEPALRQEIEGAFAL